MRQINVFKLLIFDYWCIFFFTFCSKFFHILGKTRVRDISVLTIAIIFFIHTHHNMVIARGAYFDTFSYGFLLYLLMF